MEAPNRPNPVRHIAVSAHHSRLGPVVGGGKGVFHHACTGKYYCNSSFSLRDEFSRTQVTSSCPNHAGANPVATALRANRRIVGTNDEDSQPGRTVESTLEALGPSDSVVPIPASVHQCRPGPELRCGSGVFQLAMSGKYKSDCDHSLPDADSNFSTLDVTVRGNASLTPVTCNLERAVESIVEAPNPSDPVLPSAAFDHHSRSRPVVGCGEGVFQPTHYGEYPIEIVNVRSPPDVSVTSRENAPLATTYRSKHDVIMYYQNVGGMNSDVQDYHLAVSDRCYDVIVLVETWLDSRTLSSQVFGSMYEVFRYDRNPNNSRKSCGGGVLVAVRSGLKARAVENVLWNCVEQVWVAVQLSDRTLYLCAVYIAPDRVRDNELIDVHCQSVFTIMESAAPIDEIIVLGDFNLAGVSWKPSHSGFLYPDPERSVFHTGSVSLLDCYSTATLSQINHVVNENSRSLDLCFVSARDTAPFISTAPSPLAKQVHHHPPLVITVEDNHNRVYDEISTTVSYDFRKADHRSIVNVLSSIDWESILDSDNVVTAAQTFSHVLAYVIDRHVPKRAHRKISHPPWQTSELRRLKSNKRAALRKFTKYRTLPLKFHYVRLNHEFKRVSHRCYSRYQRGIQRKLKSHPKSFWNYVKEQRKESGLPSSMVLNGAVASTPQEICHLFSEKFASVFSNERLTDEHVTLAASNVPLYGQTLGAIDVNVEMISTAASKLKSSFKPGPDGVPSVFLKKHIASLLIPLHHLFRLSISKGAFPSCWKFAHMFPVHKKGNKRDVDNYRGITSLSAVSKLFELVIMEPLLSHCKQYLSGDQHGFISGRSTSTNLLCLTSYLTESMAERTQTDVIYTDLSAAFDKLNHAIAISKLHRLGISGNLLGWFRSYLTDRQLTVAIGDNQSDIFLATSGIPQGSHLGPLIFLLYFNDVNLVIEGPRLSYADDLKIYLRIRSLDDCHFLQRQFEAFAKWCNLNRMVINPTKCSVITFTRKKEPIRFDYELMGTAIERVNHVKDLGVILDSQLTYKQHISYVVDKASRTLGFIFRIAKNFSDIYCLKSLYCSLVRSILEYCSVVWSPNYNNGAERVESVQHRFLRFVLRKLPWRDPFRLPSYENRCQLIHLELLRTRRDTSRAMFIADTLQGRIDCSAILEQVNINVQPRALRNNVMLRLPLQRTNYGMNGAIGGLQRVFNRVSSIFDFHLPRQLLRRCFSSFFSGTVNRE